MLPPFLVFMFPTNLKSSMSYILYFIYENTSHTSEMTEIVFFKALQISMTQHLSKCAMIS